eukprot:5275942-Pleurochrysis_carterae.AAC.1
MLVLITGYQSTHKIVAGLHASCCCTSVIFCTRIVCIGHLSSQKIAISSGLASRISLVAAE